MAKFIEIYSPEQLDAIVLNDLGFTSGFNWQRHLQHDLVVGSYRHQQLIGLVAFRRNQVEHYNDVRLLEISIKFQGLGLGAQLLAMVMADAFSQPEFEGFVFLRSKFNGVEKFYQHLGADTFGQNMIFDDRVSKAVVAHYLPQGGAIQWTLHKSNNN